ncbi:hypothetical protein A5649_08385 [Mycolicibacter heraklionensis]|uniref:Uncharacterized protein n=1 Tax=Mycolicibacter heraklionensis TaxID=512402 RepID=A0AA91IWR4_9MYCO|nr:hypothetical protein [Mycolicibacter heraklionensis]OBK82660.1 hypothetical protein A5649_08385 [Mycolicibacter heraklionensis]
MSAPPAEDRYGPYGFVAALGTIAIVETATWVLVPFWLAQLYLLGVATLILVPTGFFMWQTGGAKTAQVGLGILIGYLATPLTIALVVIPSVVITQLLRLA